MPKDEERAPTAYPGALMDDGEARRIAERRLAAKGWLAAPPVAESSEPLATPPLPAEGSQGISPGEQGLALSGWLVTPGEKPHAQPVGRSHQGATNAGIQSPPGLVPIAASAAAAGGAPIAGSHQGATSAGIQPPPALVSTAASAAATGGAPVAGSHQGATSAGIQRPPALVSATEPAPALSAARQEGAGPELYSRLKSDSLRIPPTATSERPASRQSQQARGDVAKTPRAEALHQSATSAGTQIPPALVSNLPSSDPDRMPRTIQAQAEPPAIPESLRPLPVSGVSAESMSQHRPQAHSVTSATATPEPLHHNATSPGTSKPPGLVRLAASRNRALPSGLAQPVRSSPDASREPRRATGSEAGIQQPPAKRGDQPPKPTASGNPREERITRSIRLTAPIYAKLREVAEARGLDLNAAISVAIAEDWWRYCVSKPPKS